MRARFRLLALAAVGLTTLLASAPAAADTGQAREPVGGPLMGHHGVIVLRNGAPALPSGIAARSWLVADLDTGEVLAAKDPHSRQLPASTLKTLTAVTLIPLMDPNRWVRVTKADVAVDGSKVGLVPGMRYRVSTLFTALLVVSANDAANTLANAAGSMQQTLDLMNAEAQHLQAYDTHAGTPSGLDAPGESSSAYDLALIARQGLKMPAFRRYVATVSSTVNAPYYRHFKIYTHNPLLGHYPGAIGVKNGYTIAARATFVGAAKRNGHTIVVTLMHERPAFRRDAEALLDWGFAADGVVTPVGRLVDPLPQAATPVRGTRTVNAAPVRPQVALPVPHHQGDNLRTPLTLLAVSTVGVLLVSRRNRRMMRRRRALPRT